LDFYLSRLQVAPVDTLSEVLVCDWLSEGKELEEEGALLAGREDQVSLSTDNIKGRRLCALFFLIPEEPLVAFIVNQLQL